MLHVLSCRDFILFKRGQKFRWIALLGVRALISYLSPRMRVTNSEGLPPKDCSLSAKAPLNAKTPLDGANFHVEKNQRTTDTSCYPQDVLRLLLVFRDGDEYWGGMPMN